MPRIVKEPLERRNEILDATQQLVITKGYDRMTIQDVIDRLQISKGAFYHYFDSKQALLDALIERMQTEAIKVIQPIVDDPQLSALEKLHRLFDTAYRWKTARKGFLMAILRAWYVDENVIVRQKQTAAMMQITTPMMQTIIEQGVEQGIFQHPRSPMVGRVVMSLIVDQGEALAELLLSSEAKDDNDERVEQIVAAYTDALERLLGLSSGTLNLIDVEALKREWAFPSSQSLISNLAKGG
ncbi:MAG: TetR/AcrR family transcriptional regulator [Caldilineaceae bacterium]